MRVSRKFIFLPKHPEGFVPVAVLMAFNGRNRSTAGTLPTTPYLSWLLFLIWEYFGRTRFVNFRSARALVQIQDQKILVANACGFWGSLASRPNIRKGVFQYWWWPLMAKTSLLQGHCQPHLTLHGYFCCYGSILDKLVSFKKKKKIIFSVLNWWKYIFFGKCQNF